METSKQGEAHAPEWCSVTVRRVLSRDWLYCSCRGSTDCTVRADCCTYSGLCISTAVLTAVCVYRLLYLQRSVHIDWCTYNGLCISTAVLTAVCAYRLLYLQRSVHIDRIALCTGCPTRYRTRHFFNNFTTNKDIATKFEADLPHCLRNVKERTHCCSNFVAIS